ncbi:MAG: hypothetical protein JWP81_3483 [Ferruginibacter sp.]|nr:hypothetical protein [Ferruginibacter sp.]
MTKILLLIVLLSGICGSRLYAQKKFGYAVLHLRCGAGDPDRNRVYYSPVIELNSLNFDKYTNGMDPAIPRFSVRYYTYAIDKWFEMYLSDKYRVMVNHPDKYERNATSVIFDENNKAHCNDDKTDPGCFFTDKQKLIMHRNKAIAESKLPKHENEICDVISL